MICANCNKEIDLNSNVCIYCGTKIKKLEGSKNMIKSCNKCNASNLLSVSHCIYCGSDDLSEKEEDPKEEELLNVLASYTFFT